MSMGVYAKDMKMPISCLSCPLQGCTADCRLTQKTYNWGLSERPSDCPLVPIPPHGRLIDADELMGRIEHDTPLSSTFEKVMRWYIENAPTAIEAEEGE
jgi:hypothetical protein